LVLEELELLMQEILLTMVRILLLQHLILQQAVVVEVQEINALAEQELEEMVVQVEALHFLGH
jgi:hypothetical protein